VRHRQLVLPARFGDRVDDIVRVFLQRVVHARLRCRARAIVIDPQSPADIDVRDVDTHAAQLRVVASDLLQARLDVPDVGDLRAKVEMNELEDVETADGFQLVYEPNELRGAETELRLLAAAPCPPARAFGVELDAHTGGRVHSELVGYLEQHIHLAQLLEHDENLVSELLPHEGEPHELLVLVAVAHDQVIRVLRQAQHGL
jgi:hypothetical protein